MKKEEMKTSDKLELGWQGAKEMMLNFNNEDDKRFAFDVMENITILLETSLKIEKTLLDVITGIKNSRNK